MNDSDLKFSFWNYCPLSPSSYKRVKEWKELGMNLAMSYVYDPSISKKEDMIALLDECAKEGIKVLIYDKRTSFYNLLAQGEEDFRADVIKASEDFSSHPATYGFCLGDEPNFEQVDAFIKTAQIVAEITHNPHNFGNLLPYFGDKELQEILGRDEKFYCSLVSKILNESKLPFIGYDCYEQCLDEGENQEEGIKHFLYGLRMYQSCCAKAGIPYYVSLIAVRHWRYRLPNKDDIKWQLSMSLAHGARGFIWFYLEQHECHPSFDEPAILSEGKGHSQIYQDLMLSQGRFKKRLLPLFDSLSFEKVDYLEGRYALDYQGEGIEVISSRPLFSTVSYFSSPDGHRYALLVNGSQRLANQYKIRLSGNETSGWTLPGDFRLFDLNSGKEVLL